MVFKNKMVGPAETNILTKATAHPCASPQFSTYCMF